jgi:hypothetical protein
MKFPHFLTIWENTNANVSGFDAVSERDNVEPQRTGSGCLIVRLSPIHYISAICFRQRPLRRDFTPLGARPSQGGCHGAVAWRPTCRAGFRRTSLDSYGPSSREPGKARGGLSSGTDRPPSQPASNRREPRGLERSNAGLDKRHLPADNITCKPAIHSLACRQ